MSAFVLGATGLVGRELVRQLAIRGTAVVAHVRPDSPRLAAWRADLTALGAAVDATPWDAVQLGARLASLRASQLYIVIGTTRRRAKVDRVTGDIYEAVDVRLTEVAVAAAQAAQLGDALRLVYLSSIGADTRARSAYLRARGKAEAAVQRSGLPWVIARPSLIVGDRGEDARSGERAAAALGDGILALAALFGASRLRARYRSTSADVLASALIRLGEAGERDRIAEGMELR